MAKKIIKEKAIEEALWESANKLRGSVEPSEYKHVVLSLIFLKYAHDRFTERRNELVAEGKEAFADNPNGSQVPDKRHSSHYRTRDCQQKPLCLQPPVHYAAP